MKILCNSLFQTPNRKGLEFGIRYEAGIAWSMNFIEPDVTHCVSISFYAGRANLFWHTLLFRPILMVFDQHSSLGHDRVVSNRQHSLNRDFGGVAQGENDHFLISEAYPRRDNDHFLTVLGLGNWENGGIFIS